jgi:hypothetical protein
VWALITATIGMILRQIQENAGILGRIVIGLVGIAWSVLTYFVVPVLLYEPVGVGQSIKRSGQIFRERWGEQFIGNATISLAVVIIGIPVVLVGALITAAIPAVGIVLLVVSIGALLAIGAACSGVFNAALYRYATTGEASGAFSLEDMNASFHPRRRKDRGAGPGGFTGQGFGGSPAMPAPPSSEHPDRPDL